MSIVRVGLAETKNFEEGWELIFGNKKKPAEKTEATEEKATTDEKPKEEQK